jgi:hypothetical protein
MQKIADADTLVKKRAVELSLMKLRLRSENILKEPIDDDFGIVRINAMMADINAQYAAMGVGVADEEDGDISEGF